jgi:hypothetical protein
MSAASGYLNLEDTFTLLAQSLSRLGGGGWQRSLVMVVNPSYAHLLSEAGYSKEDFKAALAKRAWAEVPEIRVTTGVSTERPGNLAGDGVPAAGEKVPVISDLAQLHVVVSGGWGAALSQCAVIAGASNVGKALIMKRIQDR